MQREYIENLHDLAGIAYISGSAGITHTPLEIFSDGVLSFIAALSDGILKSPLGRQHPDLTALAFWGRRANLKKLKEDFGDRRGRLGRGLCLHIAPSNIPVNFAFSWLFSLLAGNANIVRLPSKLYPQANALCTLADTLMEDFPEIRERTAFIRYDRSDETTQKLSALADCRMIWGGDETVKRLKSMPVPPRCVDIAFPDRYSVLLIDAGAVEALDDEGLNRLARGFYNDTYLMDQNACSSPQLIMWLNDSLKGRKRFWQAMEEYAQRRYVLQDAVAVDKFTQLCSDAIDNKLMGWTEHRTNLLYREELTALTQDVVRLRGRGGYFYEYVLKSMDEFFGFITDRFQTVTYFGIDPMALRDELTAQRVRGVDRIVPVGRAMDITSIWDGHNLIAELSRIISLE